jgi:predicted NBD/HSP70 family sugar kinase
MLRRWSPRNEQCVGVIVTKVSGSDQDCMLEASEEGGVVTGRSCLTIGVDIGGTKVAAGVVDERGTILATAHRDTPAEDVAQIEDAIAAVVKELSNNYDVDAVGVGAAGFIDAQRSTVMFAPHLAWRDEPLQASL